MTDKAKRLIKAKLTELGISQKEVAKKGNVSEQIVSRALGNTPPNEKLAVRAALALIRKTEPTFIIEELLND
jgi:transcriptional regulator with XRE-family HTH domain